MTLTTTDKNIVIFVGELELIDQVHTALVPELPVHFSSSIDIVLVDNSTSYLKGHKFVVSFYHDSCFRYVSTHEFLRTHYNWLYKNIKRLYGKQDSLPWYSEEDLFQEICMKYLDRILSKVDEDSIKHLRTFVANRLRRYTDYLIKEQLTKRKGELECILNQM